MKKIKKIFLTIAVITMAVLCFTFGASALEETGQCGENVYWEYNSTTKELVISGEGGMYDYEYEELDSPFNNSDIESVVINDGVTSISDCAFYGCDNLTSVTIGNSVTAIGDGAFVYCEDIDKVYAANVESWIKINFGNYTSNPMCYADELYFNGNLVTDVIIPNGTKSIGNYVFYYCNTLTSVKIPDSVTSIGESAFADCRKLSSITIPDSVTSIGELAFGNCTNLITLTIPDSVTFIGYYAFADNTVIYCNKNSSAESYAIDNELMYVCLNGSDEESIFSGKSDNLDWTIDKRTGLLKLSGSGDMVDFSSPWYEYRFYVTKIELPKGITKIGSHAFSGFIRLVEITIPDGVTSIGFYAFSSCRNLTNIILPDSVTSIGVSAFENCDSLTSITIPDSVTSIGESAFDDCDSLTSVTIPDGVTSIGDGTFCFCNSLQSVTIPVSVTSIGINALRCENLKDVYYSGTEADWNNISIGEYNEPLLNATIHYSLNTHKHSYSSKTTKSATCTSTGIKTYTCSCGDSYTKTIAKKAHTLVTVKGKAATCKATGLTNGKKCSVCGTVTVKQTTIAKTGHTIVTVKGKPATCKATGLTNGKKCSVCGTVTVKQTTIAKTGHTYTTTTTKATLTKNGQAVKKCSVCGAVSSTSTIYYPKTIKLSATTGTYNGKVKTPTVTVKDSKGNKLKKDTDYTVEYESGRRLPGKYTVTVTFKGKYSGTKTLAFSITPKVISKVSATQTTTSVTLNWSKVTGATGYRVLQKVNGKWKVLADVTKLTYTVKKLDAGTNYTFAVRPYTVDGKSTVLASTYTQLNTATKCKTPTLKLTSTKRGVANASWTNVAGETGYELYGSSKKSSGFKSIATTKVNVVKASKKKLTSKKTYYFKVRAYKTVDGVKVYSDWSAVKSVKVK